MNQYADSELLSPTQVTQAVPAWHLVQRRLHLSVKFVSFRRALEFVEKVGGIAEDLQHHPEIDIRWNQVHLALSTHSADAITGLDIRFARAVVPLVKVLEGKVDDSAFSETELVIETDEPGPLRRFWGALYGYREKGEDLLVDPRQSGPTIWFKPVSGAATRSSRLHVDVHIPARQAWDRIEEARAAGGKIISDANAPAWWVLEDQDGNEVCVATWQKRP